jgi:hypothetical protein
MGARWGLNSKINEGIASKKLTKKNPTYPLHFRGWVNKL